MKKIILAGLILLFAVTVNAQGLNSERPQFDSLDERMHRGEITTQEWYYSRLEAGYFSEQSSGWVESTERININSDLYKSLANKSGLVFYIPGNYQIIDSANGNRYIQAYLINLTDSVVLIPRKDATIDHVESFLLVHSEWKKIKDNRQLGCGNGYWKQKLEPNSYLSIHIDNHDISLGTVKVKQKIRISINGQILESEEVFALLNENQAKLLE